jgi:hypothetical protein
MRRRSFLSFISLAIAGAVSGIAQQASKKKDPPQEVLKMRVTEKLLEDGSFLRIEFDELREGDQFKLTDPNDEFEDGKLLFTCTSDAEPCDPEGNWSVMIDEIQIRNGVRNEQ